MGRADNRRKGLEAEKRIAKELSAYGTVERNTNPNIPDFDFTADSGILFAIEAKSIRPISKCRVGRINLRNLSKLEEYSVWNSSYLLVLVELKIRTGNLYYVLPEVHLRSSFTVYHVLRCGIPLGQYFNIPISPAGED